MFNKRVVALAALIGLAIGCGERKMTPEKDGNVAPATNLRKAYAQWLGELAAASDRQTGWSSADDCDATLWAGEAAAAGAPVDVLLAELAPGEVHRRPGKPCWTPEDGDVGSKSTVSQDMLTGYLWGLWARRDLAARHFFGWVDFRIWPLVG